MAEMCNIERIMWANDFPHSDSTWPRSDEAIALLAEGLTQPQLKRVLHDNCAELYGL
ncbi:MAG: amidohydrolase family protein [Deltaproteobacteria bacterium]|nr:amidohydrolase family protein [Deltaproteobacteria bacterium]